MALPRLAAILCVVSVVATAPPARAQGNVFPTATTLEALTTYPNFYHLKPIAVRGEVTVKGNQVRLVPPGGTGRGVELVVVDGHAEGNGVVEVRGQFWDIGRMQADDPSAANTQLADFVRERLGDRWPAHGELLAIKVASTAPPPPPSPSPSLRLLSLDPEHYEGQALKLTGQFSGRNLLGDLPQAPRISRTDFVIRNAGGAVWVTGIAPRGRGWQLNPDLKLDVDQWLQVEGVVRHGNGLVWVEAKTVNEMKAGVEDRDAQPAPPPPPARPPEIVFSLPAQDDTDVSPTTTVKIQTSRDLDPDTFDQHIAVTYLGQPPGTPGIPVKATFDRANRVLQLTFAQPLERFRTVKVELLEGIKGTDGQPLKPFTLTFSVGG